MPLAGCVPVELGEHRDLVLRHDAEEAVRLTYVAATRARELLVVPVVGDEVVEGWVDVLHPVLYPKPSEGRRARPAPGCPAFGSDSVLAGPAGRRPDRSVQPGLHVSRAGSPVVWWDPRALKLDKPNEAGLRQQRILAADETGVTAEGSERAHAEWQGRRIALRERGCAPTVVVHTVTEAKALAERSSDLGARSARVEATRAVGQPRPAGRRFGTLVHAILASIDLAADEAQVGAMASATGQRIGATQEEIRAAVLAVVAALDHPLLARARAQGAQCRRESPVVLVAADGSLIEGVLDLAFRDERGAGWTVVDYKTDVDVQGRQGDYEAQILLYAQAVARATGESAVGVLLRV
jgi:ATP-dependent exoDNAse (exonuclease V) beta subunit